MDIYMSMGFPEALARRAPSDPEIGVPWLLRATTIGTMPKRLQREGSFAYTFYGSRVEFMDTMYMVRDYDPNIQIIGIENALASIWVSLSDPNLRILEERHGHKPERIPLRAVEHFPLPVLDLSIDAMPTDLQQQLAENGTLEQSDLGGDWDFHTAARDGNIWLALLRLSNKCDPSVRFCPAFQRPPSTSSNNINRYRNEVKSKIALYCMAINRDDITVQTVLHTHADDFLMNVHELEEPYKTVFQECRSNYWRARDVIRGRLRTWKEACIAPLKFEKIVWNNGRAQVHTALTEWSFKPLQNDMQYTIIPFYFSVLFKEMFQPQLEANEYAIDTYPSHLFPEQHAAYAWLVRTEERGRHPGWWTRQEITGFTWSFSKWGARVRGMPPDHTGGIFYTPPGAGKTVLMTSLCAQRNLSTLIIVPKRARIDYWMDHFKKYAPNLNVLSLVRRTHQWDEHADVVVTTWTIYRNHLDANGPWTRLIIDDAHQAKRQRDRWQFLSSIECKTVWMLTNVRNVYPVYRDMLKLPSTRLDRYITAPDCCIDDRLSPVAHISHALELTNTHRHLRQVFFHNNVNDTKAINKWYRSIETQPTHVPQVYYATDRCPQGWSPVQRHEITDQRVKDQLKEPCSICYDTPETAVITSCNHVFCSKCLRRHMENHNNCPLCRGIIDRCQFLPCTDDNHYIFDTKTQVWVHIPATTRTMLHNYATNMKEIENIVEALDGKTVFVSEHPLKIRKSSTHRQFWDHDTCLRMTYKQLFRDDTDISEAKHIVCLGPLNSDDDSVIARKLQRINCEQTSYIHTLTY